MSEQQYAYRYTDRHWAPMLDQFEQPMGDGRKEISITMYKILKKTPKGFWIETGLDEKKFVLSCANKTFACSTKEDAMQSYIFRKKKQIKILSRQLVDAELFLNIARSGKFAESHYYPAFV